MSNNRNIPFYKRQVMPEVVQGAGTAGSSALIQSFSNFGQGVGQVAEAVGKQEAKRERDTLQYNMSNTYRQLSYDAMQENDPHAALKRYQESAEAYKQGVVKQTNPFNRSYVNSMADYYSSVHADPLVKNSILATQREAKTQFADIDAGQTQDINNSISSSNPIIDEKTGENKQFHATMSLYNQRERSREQAFKEGMISESDYKKQKKDAYTDLLTNVTLKEFGDALQAGHGTKYWEYFNKKQFNNIDEHQKEIIGSLMIKKESQFNHQSQYTKAELKTQFSSEVSRVSDGGQPKSELREHYVQQYPSQEEAYDHQISLAQRSYSIKQAALYAPPSQVNALLTTMRPKDVNDEHYPEDKATYDKLSAAITKQEAAIKTDPVKFAEEDPSVKATIQHFEMEKKAGLPATNNPNTPFNTTTINPTKARSYWMLQKGIPLDQQPVMTKADADERVTAFSASSADQQIMMLKQLKQEFPDAVSFKGALNQMIKQGMPANYSLASNYDINDPATIDMMAALNEKVSDQKKSLPESLTKSVDKLISHSTDKPGFLDTTSNRMRQFFAASRGAASTDQEHYNITIKDTLSHLAYYAINTNKAADSSSAYEWAVNHLTHGMQFTSMDGQTIAMPADLPASTIKSYANEQRLTELPKFDFVLPKKFAYQGFSAQGQLELHQEEYRQQILNGHWVTNDAMTGMTWTAINGQIPVNANGHPFQFLFEDAKDFHKNYLPENTSSKTLAGMLSFIDEEGRAKPGASVKERVAGELNRQEDSPSQRLSDNSIVDRIKEAVSKGVAATKAIDDLPEDTKKAIRRGKVGNRRLRRQIKQILDGKGLPSGDDDITKLLHGGE